MADKNKFFGSRAFQKGGMAVIFTACVVALVILINVAASVLSDRFPLSLDLTVGQDYSMDLSDEYTDYLKKVDKKVNIIVCASEESFENSTFTSYMLRNLSLSDRVTGSVSDTTSKYARQVGVFVKDFAKLNSNFSISFRDPDSATDFAYVTGKYPSESFSYGDIIVECVHGEDNERYSVLHMSDYFSTEINNSIYYSYYTEAYDITGSTLASNLTSAVYVTSSENPVKLAVYTGSGCEVPDALSKLLERNNYELEKVSSFAEISGDAKAVIIASPTRDLNKESVDALDRYLKNSGNNGRNLIYIANTSSGTYYSTPILNEYLSEWGIQVTEGYVCETKDNLYNVQYPVYVAPVSAGSSYTANLDNNTKLSYPYGLFSAMKLSSEEKDYYTTESILKSSDTATYLPYSAPEDWSIDTSPITGPYDYVMQSTLVNTQSVESHVVAFAGDTFFGFDLFEKNLYQTDYLNAATFANAPLTLNIFNTLTGADEQETVEITTKTINTTSFYDKVSESGWPKAVRWVFIIVLPLVMIVAGITVFVVRKRK